MPVKWDARTDQILLLKILETTQISANVKAIADAWPADEVEKPTPRAITERLVKIRKEIGSKSNADPAKASSVTPATPQKRAPRGSKSGSAVKASGAKKTPHVNGNSKGTRAANASEEDEESADDPSQTMVRDEDEVVESQSKKRVKGAIGGGKRVKVEMEGEQEGGRRGFEGEFGGDEIGDIFA